RWTKPGRLGPDATAAGGSIPASAVLVPWNPWTWRAGVQKARAFGPDLVVAQWWHPLLGPCLRSITKRLRRGGAEVAFVCHNVRPHERFPFTRMLSRRALRTASRLFALSGAVADELRVLAPAVPTQVLSHPPNLPGERPADGHSRSSWAERIG